MQKVTPKPLISRTSGPKVWGIHVHNWLDWKVSTKQARESFSSSVLTPPGVCFAFAHAATRRALWAAIFEVTIHALIAIVRLASSSAVLARGAAYSVALHTFVPVVCTAALASSIFVL